MFRYREWPVLDSHCHLKPDPVLVQAQCSAEGAAATVGDVAVCGTCPSVDWGILEHLAARDSSSSTRSPQETAALPRKVLVGFGVHPWFVLWNVKSEPSLGNDVTSSSSDDLPRCCGGDENIHSEEQQRQQEEEEEERDEKDGQKENVRRVTSIGASRTDDVYSASQTLSVSCKVAAAKVEEQHAPSEKKMTHLAPFQTSNDHDSGSRGTLDDECHPEAWMQQLEGILQRYPNVFVGEIGLDKFRPQQPFETEMASLSASVPNWVAWSRAELQNTPSLLSTVGSTTPSKKSAVTRSSWIADLQVAFLRRQMLLAVQYRRPVSVHLVTGGFAMFLQLLHAMPVLPPSVIFHGFSGSLDFLQNNLGKMPKKKQRCFYFGFGARTTAIKKDFLSLLEAVPVDRVLLESDEFLQLHRKKDVAHSSVSVIPPDGPAVVTTTLLPCLCRALPPTVQEEQDAVSPLETVVLTIGRRCSEEGSEWIVGRSGEPESERRQRWWDAGVARIQQNGMDAFSSIIPVD